MFETLVITADRLPHDTYVVVWPDSWSMICLLPPPQSKPDPVHSIFTIENCEAVVQLYVMFSPGQRCVLIGGENDFGQPTV